MTAVDKHYRVSWDETSGLARAVWLPGAVCGIDEARALEAEVQALGRADVLLLVDLRNLDSIDRPAREFFMDLHSNYRSVALVAGSAPTRMLANVFLGLMRGPIPIKMFTDETDAVAWLQSQR